MITAIVRGVQETLNIKKRHSAGGRNYIFRVCGCCCYGRRSVRGEGCSTAGGCATCQFMKMNDIDALFRVVEGYSELISGKTVPDVGVHPILHMKSFMEGQKFRMSW
ncbi:hypothetical protein PsorP6_005890 [Peronosclerospora sorghi]|uniref:Uncharacterized protein n=1 Tax=Peronosclerospora sorghi TaxID=230839 RepID=A0ACC0W6G1_9STRA|nr:hypothetical protein PsorP6_005890 [Peronosclerospora sorghi]